MCADALSSMRASEVSWNWTSVASAVRSRNVWAECSQVGICICSEEGPNALHAVNAAARSQSMDSQLTCTWPFVRTICSDPFSVAPLPAVLSRGEGQQMPEPLGKIMRTGLDQMHSLPNRLVRLLASNCFSAFLPRWPTSLSSCSTSRDSEMYLPGLSDCICSTCAVTCIKFAQWRLSSLIQIAQTC